MTLIEVVAGLVVLAVLVSAVTLARGRFARQWGASRQKLEAAEAVDRMLAGWVGDGDGNDTIPVHARGTLEGVEGCSWRTGVVPDPAATRLGAVVVRLEVLQGSTRLLSVDVLKHVRRRSDAKEGA